MSEHREQPMRLSAKADADEFGEIYLWLKRHRRLVAKLVRTKGTPWRAITSQMEADGVRNKAGGPVVPKLARNTWYRLQPDLEKERAARADQAPRRTRSGQPNVEPPSRPGVNYHYDRPGAQGSQPPSYGRERYPETYHQAEPPAQIASQAAEQRPNRRLTAAEKFAQVEEQMRRADGFQPKPRNRGPIE